MRILSTIAISIVFAVTAFGQQSLKPGEIAPDFSLQAMDGQLYNLNQLQGKIVLLTFWSTRCQICHSEIPKLNRVAANFNGQDVVFIAATMDNNQKVEAFLQKIPFNFRIAPNSFGLMLKYADRDAAGNINMGFPAHFLIDRRGAIAMRAFGWDKSARLESEITRLLSSN
jgi:peroxiredoxin